jgi:hypothetical protein
VEDRGSSNSQAADEIPPTSSFDSQMPQAKDVESLNSCLVVEVELNEIPPTSGFDSQMPQAKDVELLNSCLVVEIDLNEIPPTSGFDSQMPQVKDMESLNSCLVVEVDLNEIPSTLGFDFVVLRSLVMEVNPFHVIFNLNEVLIATHFNRGSHAIILHIGLKEFLEKCFVQFQCIFGL